LFLSESPTVPPPGIPPAPDVARNPCPSRDFPAFLDAFGESIDVQREYTHIPLMYGQLNAKLIGTARENAAFTTQTINSFDTIPIADTKDGGRILRGKIKRRERGLKIKVEPEGESNEGIKIVTILLPGTGFHLEYHFASTDTCWELVRIDDRSKS
jgi:hypothetical protein